MYNFNSNNRFRIRCDASANNDQIYFDQVIITGDAASEAAPTNAEIMTNFNQTVKDKVKLYPNPVTSELNIDLGNIQFDEVTIFSSRGNIIEKIDVMTRKVNVDLSNLPSGMYFVTFVSDGLATTKRFIKK